MLLPSTSQPGLSEPLPEVLHTVANSQEEELSCQTEQFRAVFTFFAFDPIYNYQGGEARQLVAQNSGLGMRKGKASRPIVF